MDARPQPPFMPIAAPADSLPESLADVLDSIWSAIEGGVRERWTPWGLPLLVTSDGAGAPHARVLALRGADRDARTLLFHTDARSDKVSHLAMDSRAAVTFWHPSDAVEVRFTGAAKIHRDDAIAHEAWKQASP